MLVFELLLGLFWFFNVVGVDWFIFFMLEIPVLLGVLIGFTPEVNVEFTTTVEEFASPMRLMSARFVTLSDFRVGLLDVV
jgi:hypothetical protein